MLIRDGVVDASAASTQQEQGRVVVGVVVLELVHVLVMCLCCSVLFCVAVHGVVWCGVMVSVVLLLVSCCVMDCQQCVCCVRALWANHLAIQSKRGDSFGYL